MKNSICPWWCILLRGITFLFILLACLGLFFVGWRSIQFFIIFGGATVVAGLVFLNLPAQACEENRALGVRLLICIGMVLACWLIPELLTRFMGWELGGYWCMIDFFLPLDFQFCSWGNRYW